MNLSIEEQEILADLTSTEEYWAVINKVIAMGVERQKDNFLSCNTELDRPIVMAKARLEGAQMLQLFVAGMKKRKKEK